MSEIVKITNEGPESVILSFVKKGTVAEFIRPDQILQPGDYVELPFDMASTMLVTQILLDDTLKANLDDVVIPDTSLDCTKIITWDGPNVKIAANVDDPIVADQVAERQVSLQTQIERQVSLQAQIDALSGTIDPIVVEPLVTQPKLP